MMRKLSAHTEWLSLVEYAGPFLSVGVLEESFPQGLDAVATPKRQKLRAAYDEWREAVDEADTLLPALHKEWIRLVLSEMLEYDSESLVVINEWKGETISVSPIEQNGIFSPDLIIRSPSDGQIKIFVAALDPDTDLETSQCGDNWAASYQERMILLCRNYNVRLGLLTNGERWMLVNAPSGSSSGTASWYARLWFSEPLTLKAFQSLLSVRRCFGPKEETLETLFDKSLERHEEVTDTLGEQVRRAVEVLIQGLDKADADRNRELLHDVPPPELYEAGLTLMMRLVFILCAEERDLLLLGDTLYDECYAVSTLRGILSEEAELYGPEVLDRRYDAWARLLSVFRAIYAGSDHENLRLPALGGSLFDPDRFPFLEGRAKNTHWTDAITTPLPIDNRTVLLLLNSLQILEQSGGALLLSYRALDVEQIGQIYEGLLEYTATRVRDITIGLKGSQKAKNPNIALAELESATLEGDATLLALIKEKTQRSESAITKDLAKIVDARLMTKIHGICGGDSKLALRIKPFANLLRTDAWEEPIIYKSLSFMVTLGADRRETGTHYTPKSLTESIVTATLEPVVYIGPAEGKPEEEWTLKSSAALLELKICDPAMGSGAFLVQTCRYLGEKLVDAWKHEEDNGKVITIDGKALDTLGDAEPLPKVTDDRLVIARRLVAERCLYGVDINPLAVELAKLSIWLVTLAKGRPFGFLDHNLRSGDSLLGIHKLEQLTSLSMNPAKHHPFLFGQNIKDAVKDAMEIRKNIRTVIVRDINDVITMAQMDNQARQKLKNVELIADAMIGAALKNSSKPNMLDSVLNAFASTAENFLNGDAKVGEQIAHFTKTDLSLDLPEGKSIRKPFHWALEFPEVFENGGFDGIVGNPPFVSFYSKQSAADSGTAITLSFLTNNYDFITDKKQLGRHNLFMFFIQRAYHVLKNTGCAGILLDHSINNPPSQDIRIYLAKKTVLKRIVLDINAFEGVASRQIILSFSKQSPQEGNSVNIGKWLSGEDTRVNIIQSDLLTGRSYSELLSESGKSNVLESIRKVSSNFQLLVGKSNIRTCITFTGKKDAFIVNHEKTTEKNIFPLAEGSKSLSHAYARLIIQTYIKYDLALRDILNEQYRDQAITDGKRTPMVIGLGDFDSFMSPKIFIRLSDKRITATYSQDKICADLSLYIVTLQNKELEYGEIHLYWILGILNSSLISYYARNAGLILNLTQGTPQIRLASIRELPIVIPPRETRNKLIELVSCVLASAGKDLSKRKEIDAIVFDVYNIEISMRRIIENEMNEIVLKELAKEQTL